MSPRSSSRATAVTHSDRAAASLLLSVMRAAQIAWRHTGAVVAVWTFSVGLV